MPLKDPLLGNEIIAIINRDALDGKVCIWDECTTQAIADLAEGPGGSSILTETGGSKKTSDFDDAGTLNGANIISILQGGNNVITTLNDVTTFVTNTIVVPVGADPTAIGGPDAINGAGLTFMRSDACPAIQIGSDSQLGLLQVDGTSITATVDGVISTIFNGYGFDEDGDGNWRAANPNDGGYTEIVGGPNGGPGRVRGGPTTGLSGGGGAQLWGSNGAGGDGGAAEVIAGDDEAGGNGGPVNIKSGNALTSGDGGDITLEPGLGAMAGRDGLIIFNRLPTSDPGVPGALYVAAGVLMVSP